MKGWWTVSIVGGNTGAGFFASYSIDNIEHSWIFEMKLLILRSFSFLMLFLISSNIESSQAPIA